MKRSVGRLVRDLIIIIAVIVFIIYIIIRLWPWVLKKIELFTVIFP